MRKTATYWLAAFILLGIAGSVFAAPGEGNHSNTVSQETRLRVGVVGDTGIGERAFHWGFLAVQKALRESHPDVLLHLGDFVYQPKFQPQACPEKYIREIRETLVEPYPFRLFVPGDNDLPPHIGKPKASGCWSQIDPLDTPFDEVNAGPNEESARFEGTKIIGNTFFAVLNTYPWKDPTEWLAPKIRAARENGLWVILALHEPAITTAWYLDKRDTVLKQVNALQPDLVFSGNQHSYERFHPLGAPEKGEKLPVQKSASSRYQRGEGTIHIVSGGGGATFKPFADQQGYEDRTAPEDVFNALAKRALMNHYIILEISSKFLKGTTYRVCPGEEPTGKSEPRWKPNKSMWESIALECEGKPEGVAEFDQFEIAK
jgi:calcineurin-like phosphoesterase family protein